MTCEQCNEWLGDAVDGTLDAERQAQIDAHCRGCAACRELLNDLKEIRAAAATLDRHTPSPERVASDRGTSGAPRRCGFAQPRRSRASAWPQLAAAAALVMMLGAAAWFGVRHALARRQRRRGVRPRAERRVGAAARRTALSERHHRARAADRRAETTRSTRRSPPKSRRA